MWQNLKFGVKISTLVGMFVLFTLIIIAGYHYMSIKVRDIGIESSSIAMLDGYKGELKDIVDYTAVALGKTIRNIPKEEDKIATLSKYINKARFLPDESGYMFIYKEGVNVVHPIKKTLEGKDLIDLKDSNGSPLIRDLHNAATSGGGFVEYLWDKPDSGVTPKLSYARMIPNTQYWIGTGVYIDDIAKKEEEIKSTMVDFSSNYLMVLSAVLVGIFMLLIIPLTLLMVKSMVSPLHRLTDTAQEYSRGKLDGEFIDDDRKDEIGILAGSVKLLGRSTKIVMERLQKVSS